MPAIAYFSNRPLVSLRLAAINAIRNHASLTLTLLLGVRACYMHVLILTPLALPLTSLFNHKNVTRVLTLLRTLVINIAPHFGAISPTSFVPSIHLYDSKVLCR